VPNHADLREELAFGAVWNRPGLDRRQRAQVAVAAFTALQLDG
jgi:alkylhydroperoxidase/carboxymuconolactone decarboxylase family protein YurZ